MTMRRIKRTIPDLPEIRSEGRLDRETEAHIRSIMSRQSHHGCTNQYRPEGVKNKWGYQAQFEVIAIRASKEPFEGIPAEDSLSRQLPPLHLAFETKDGELHGYRKCVSPSKVKPTSGVVLQDRRGRGWFMDVEDFDDKASSPKRIREISLETIPIMKMFYMPKDGPYLLDQIPAFSGNLEIDYDVIVRASGGVHVLTGHSLQGSMVNEMTRQIDEILDREDRILAAIGPILTEERMRDILGVSAFPTTTNIFPSYSDPRRRSFDDRQEKFCTDIARALRDAGLCAEIPNGGHHAIRGVAAWNHFLRGDLDNPDDIRDRGLIYKLHELGSTPLFRCLMTETLNGVLEGEKAVWERKNPGKSYDYEDRTGYSAADYAEICATCVSCLTEVLYREKENPYASSDWSSRLDDKLHIGIIGGPLRPVLGVRGDTAKLIPLEVDPEPPIARHLELSLPSGRMAMADWFRIPGFTEAVKVIGKAEMAEIDTASGRDFQTRAYYETMGLISVGGGRSPYAYDDTDGVWRMGHVDESDDAFWTEGRERTDLRAPEPAWRTCSDLWATTFADVETIADILMTSGEYPDRASALATVEDYCKGYGTTIQDMGTKTLHVYMPTGYGMRGHFEKRLRAGELEYPTWRRDTFLLSREPLTIPAELLEEHDWREGRIDPDLRLNGDGAAPPDDDENSLDGP